MTDGAAGAVAFVLAMLLLVGPLDLESAEIDAAIRKEREGVLWIDDPAKIPPELVEHPVAQDWLRRRAAKGPAPVVPRYWDVDEGPAPKRLSECDESRARITISYNNGIAEPWLRFCTESASLRWRNTEGGE